LVSASGPGKARHPINTSVAWWALSPFGDLQTAIRDYELALAVAQLGGNVRRPARVRYELGRAYADRGDTDQAVRLRFSVLADAASLDSKDLTDLRYGLAIVYVEANQPAKALELLDASDTEARGFEEHRWMSLFRVRALVGVGNHRRLGRRQRARDPGARHEESQSAPT
jgi:hypothetical protein